MNRFERYDSQTVGESMVEWFEILDRSQVKEKISSDTPKITSIGIGADAGFKMDPWYTQA